MTKLIKTLGSKTVRTTILLIISYIVMAITGIAFIDGAYLQAMILAAMFGIVATTIVVNLLL